MTMEASCYEDLDALGTELDDPLAELDQDNYHRLIEDPGSNPDDRDRGLGIFRFLSGKAEDLASLVPRAEAELRKNPANKEVRAQITPLETGHYLLQIRVVPDGDVLGIVVTNERLLQLRLGRGEVKRL